MDEEIRKGRQLVLIAIIIFITVTVLNSINNLLYLPYLGLTSLISPLFNLGLALVFSYLLYKGYKLSRIVLGIASIVSSFGPLYMIIESIYIKLPISLFVIYLGFMFILNIAVGIFILTSKDIKLFIEYQKNNKHSS